MNKEELPEEFWRVLVQAGNMYSRYKVSNHGRVWDLETDKEVSQVITGKPQYKYVNLHNDEGKRVLRRVNNIVSWTFHGKPPTPKHTSDHIDRDKFNNVEWNLRWADKKVQAANKEGMPQMPCGTPVLEWLILSGYSVEEGIGKYLLHRLRRFPESDITNLKFEYSAMINPYPKKWIERKSNIGVEYEGIWYPNQNEFAQEYNLLPYEVSAALKEGIGNYLGNKKIKSVFSKDPRTLNDYVDEGKFYKGSLYKVLRSYSKSEEMFKSSGLALEEFLAEGSMSEVSKIYNNGKWYTYTDLSKISGVCPVTLNLRVKRGFTPEQAMTPIRNPSKEKVLQGGDFIFLVNGEYYWWHDIATICGYKTPIKAFTKSSYWVSTLTKDLETRGYFLQNIFETYCTDRSLL